MKNLQEIHFRLSCRLFLYFLLRKVGQFTLVKLSSFAKFVSKKSLISFIAFCVSIILRSEAYPFGIIIFSINAPLKLYLKIKI